MSRFVCVFVSCVLMIELKLCLINLVGNDKSSMAAWILDNKIKFKKNREESMRRKERGLSSRTGCFSRSKLLTPQTQYIKYLMSVRHMKLSSQMQVLKQYCNLILNSKPLFCWAGEKHKWHPSFIGTSLTLVIDFCAIILISNLTVEAVSQIPTHTHHPELRLQ